MSGESPRGQHLINIQLGLGPPIAGMWGRECLNSTAWSDSVFDFGLQTSCSFPVKTSRNVVTAYPDRVPAGPTSPCSSVEQH